MTHTDWVPTREAELADLARRWITGVSDAAKQNAFGWEAAECTAVAALLCGAILLRGMAFKNAARSCPLLAKHSCQLLYGGM